MEIQPEVRKRVELAEPPKKKGAIPLVSDLDESEDEAREREARIEEALNRRRQEFGEKRADIIRKEQEVLKKLAGNGLKTLMK